MLGKLKDETAKLSNFLSYLSLPTSKMYLNAKNFHMNSRVQKVLDIQGLAFGESKIFDIKIEILITF